LTPEQERRLANTAIDYSDIPPMTGELPDALLYAEDYLDARLLDILCEHCGTSGGELDSHGDPVSAALMTLCAEGFYIHITGQFGPRILATLLPQGRMLLDQLQAERERDRARAIDWSQCRDAESVPGVVSGAWVVKGTRVTIQAIPDNAEAGCSAEEIAAQFPVPVEVVRRILAFADAAQRAREVESLRRLYGPDWPRKPANP
jgi:uncharacterized protein (DUF433 family)